MNAPPRLELERPRDVSALLGDSLRTYYRNAGSFLAISAAIVIPVELIVGGFGLEQFTADYDPTPPVAQTVIPTIVAFLVIAPLITATCIHALREISGGQRPRAGRAIQAGLDAFTPLFLAIALAALGIVLELALLVIPGLYLLVRWYFVPQVVVLEDARGPDALARSGELVHGAWWRTLGVIALANIAATLPGLLFISPFSALADSTDRALWQLVGEITAATLTTPFVALVSTLLYFDLRTRR